MSDAAVPTPHINEQEEVRKRMTLLVGLPVHKFRYTTTAGRSFWRHCGRERMRRSMIMLGGMTDLGPNPQPKAP